MFKLEIDTGNAAFDDDAKPGELARILRDLADKIENGADMGAVRDVNGNRVGRFDVNA
ncbi:hypothetical protein PAPPERLAPAPP_01130 [Brevundimonas phage vB_BpoS-Papperlapapp]|uniref:Uncharacterized protein n=1 Tax=Brevundimonas phage vB_BpoS-Domovoi TaxID=2948598 RepID=A0A9E7MRG4_9CAUD|nr:hypothetical protein DOMOVOI_00070 [Brevundimonas phage vB_BpoS-Domovoi]USN15855.1 hypothetical protein PAPPERLAPAPP_01130 [Brevundimonas phage vB_BpoS-Papperlapapp]UTC29619.1 hypothetical protein BAMBUS_05610 [Brevundimonas phage vB_BpoS-Bambus]